MIATEEKERICENLTLFKLEKQQYLNESCSDKSLKGIDLPHYK